MSSDAPVFCARLQTRTESTEQVEGVDSEVGDEHHAAHSEQQSRLPARRGQRRRLQAAERAQQRHTHAHREAHDYFEQLSVPSASVHNADHTYRTTDKGVE